MTSVIDAPGFDDPDGRALACTIAGFGGSADLHVMMNMYWEALDFDIPVDPQREWHLVIDTSAESPGDIVDLDRAAPYTGYRWSCSAQIRRHVAMSSPLIQRFRSAPGC